MKKRCEIIRAAKQEALLDRMFDAIEGDRNRFFYEERLESLVLPLPTGITTVAFREKEEREDGYWYTINDSVKKEIIESYYQILVCIWMPVVCYYEIHPILQEWMHVLHIMQLGHLPSNAKEEVAEIVYSELRGLGIVPFNDLEELQME